MNRQNAFLRYTGSIVAVGTAPVTHVVASPSTPPGRGAVALIEVELTSGPSTALTTRLIEGASGHVLYESLVDPFPVSGIIRLQPLSPIPFVGIPVANVLTLEVTTDDGTQLSTVDIALEIQGA